MELPPQFYLTIEQAIDEFGPQEAFYHEYIALKLYTWLQNKLPKDPIILDVGSGHGLLTRLVQILFDAENTFGIDIKREIVDYTQEKYPTIIFKQSNNADFPFDNNTFDLVLAQSVFHHIPEQELPYYCKEIDRVLKTGGIAVIIELNPYNIYTRRTFEQNPQEQGMKMVAPHTIKKILKKYGKTSVRYFGFFQQYFISLRFIEPYITKIPFGSFYGLIFESSKNNIFNKKSGFL